VNASVLRIERDDTFGRLKVLRRCESKRKRGPRYECGCACGKIVRVKGSKLRKMEVTSCLTCKDRDGRDQPK